MLKPRHLKSLKKIRMKKFIYLLPFLLLSFSAFSQDPCEGMEDEFVCVELTPGFVVPMSACEAMLANLSVVDCDDYGIVFENDTSDVVINDWDEECDCNWDSEEFVCVFLFGDVLEVHACDVQCGSFGDLGEFGEFEIVDCEDLVYGCNDSNALNYNEDATVNDGSCEYEDWGTDCDCDWNSEEYICLAFDDEIMTVHVCDLECNSWGEDFLGFDFEVVDCEDLVYGCNDSNALNYNEDATVNDGSCEYEDLGEECDCDWDSEEYVCLSFDGEIMVVHVCELECNLWGDDFLGFDFEVVDCEGEDDGEDIEDEIENILEDFYGGGQFNQENFQNLADLLIELFVFPNPLEDGDGLGVFIDSNMESSATVQIVNNLGQTVYSSRENLLKGKNVLEIDVNELESGFYFTLVNADNGISATQKFIKN